MSDAKPIISTVICTYNRYPYLGAAIDSLLAQTAGETDFEILVIDNTPPCAMREGWAKRFADHARVKYTTVDTAGLANARNVAVAMAKGSFVAFLDDDAIASPGWVEAYANAFETFGDKAHIAGGAVKAIFEEARPSWLADELLVYFTMIDWGGVSRFLGDEHWVAGANIAFRRTAYLDAGGCDTRLGRVGSNTTLLSEEETELTGRIKKTGAQVLYVPDAKVDHLIPASRITRTWLRRRIIWQAISDQIVGKVDPETTEQRERTLANYISAVPPDYRSLRAFYYDTEDPQMFNWQIQALYSFYAVTMARGELFPGDI